jgi:hypothetical protein
MAPARSNLYNQQDLGALLGQGSGKRICCEEGLVMRLISQIQLAQFVQRGRNRTQGFAKPEMKSNM